MKILLAISSWVLLLSGPLANAAPPPNIVFVLVDDLGYGDLGCYGQKIVPTPNLDRIAAEGMRFTQAYAGNNCCAPSRCCLLTGLHSGHATVRNNGGSLAAGDVTVAQVLRQAGYATGIFGKWHLGGYHSPGSPLAMGFDYHYGIDPGSGGSLTHFVDTLYRNGQPEAVTANQNGKQGIYDDDLYLADAIRYIREHRERPFFVYLALRTPHKTLEAPKDVITELAGKIEETGKGDAKPHTTRAAMIVHLDRILPDLFAALRELKIERNTLVIFASDNGPATAGGADPAFFNSTAGLRGVKFTMYEGGIRVPMIAWWPGTITAGQTCDFPCAFWDFMPTLAELAGVACPKTDGLSLLPLFKGDRAGQTSHKYLYWERAGVQAAWAGGLKSVFAVATDKLECFDLNTDPQEKTSITQTKPEVVEQLQKIMQESHLDNPQYPLHKKGRSK